VDLLIYAFFSCGLIPTFGAISAIYFGVSGGQ